MKVRLAQIQEIAAIAAIDLEVNITSWNIREYTESLNNKAHSVYVLELQNNELVGAIVINLACDEAEILQFCIKRGHQRHGYGRFLLQYVIKILRLVYSVARVFLEVRDENTPAILLYQSCGFKTVGTRPNYYKVDNWSFDALVMLLET